MEHSYDIARLEEIINKPNLTKEPNKTYVINMECHDKKK